MHAQGIKGIPLINEVREVEHARVRGHLMHALNADTVAASIWQLSDTVQRSIAAVTRCHAEGPQGDAQSRRARSIDSGALLALRSLECMCSPGSRTRVCHHV